MYLQAHAVPKVYIHIIGDRKKRNCNTSTYLNNVSLLEAFTLDILDIDPQNRSTWDINNLSEHRE